MTQDPQHTSTPRIKHVGLVNKDGQWYSRVGVAEGTDDAHPAGIVESGYTCRDGVWYKCLTLASD
jgi:hypothetical protein